MAMRNPRKQLCNCQCHHVSIADRSPTGDQNPEGYDSKSSNRNGEITNMNTNPIPNEVEVPDNLFPVLAELKRLADEAATAIANGLIFPGLSTLAGINPLVGMLTEFCAARVVPDIETGNVRVDPHMQHLMCGFDSHGNYL